MLCLGHHKNQGGRIYDPQGTGEIDVIVRDVDYRVGERKARCEIFQNGTLRPLVLKEDVLTPLDQNVDLQFIGLSARGQVRIRYHIPRELKVDRWKYSPKGNRRLQRLTIEEYQ